MSIFMIDYCIYQKWVISLPYNDKQTLNFYTMEAIRTNFQMIVEFKEYAPADEHVTSNDEIAKIADHFELAGKSRLDLQNLRDMVVLVYTNWLDDAEKNCEDFRPIMSAMQSITTVIDHYKYNA